MLNCSLTWLRWIYSTWNEGVKRSCAKIHLGAMLGFFARTCYGKFSRNRSWVLQWTLCFPAWWESLFFFSKGRRSVGADHFWTWKAVPFNGDHGRGAWGGWPWPYRQELLRQLQRLPQLSAGNTDLRPDATEPRRQEQRVLDHGVRRTLGRRVKSSVPWHSHLSPHRKRQKRVHVQGNSAYTCN